jgi:hypothetical protein
MNNIVYRVSVFYRSNEYSNPGETNKVVTGFD